MDAALAGLQTYLHSGHLHKAGRNWSLKNKTNYYTVGRCKPCDRQWILFTTDEAAEYARQRIEYSDMRQIFTYYGLEAQDAEQTSQAVHETR